MQTKEQKMVEAWERGYRMRVQKLVLNHRQQFDASQLQCLDQHCMKSSQIISLLVKGSSPPLSTWADLDVFYTTNVPRPPPPLLHTVHVNDKTGW